MFQDPNGFQEKVQAGTKRIGERGTAFAMMTAPGIGIGGIGIGEEDGGVIGVGDGDLIGTGGGDLIGTGAGGTCGAGGTGDTPGGIIGIIGGGDTPGGGTGVLIGTSTITTITTPRSGAAPGIGFPPGVITIIPYM